MTSLHIVKPGMLTTVQDLGRWGFQHRGVPVAGPMDVYSHRLANLLVGNTQDAALLEITLMGPCIEFEAEALFAVTGAEFDLSLDDQFVPMNVAALASAGSHLRFGRRRAGARAYLAVAGGILVPEIFGSRATHLVCRLGGMSGRMLSAGDRLDIGHWPDVANPGRQTRAALPIPLGGSTVRVMLGPQHHLFTPAALAELRDSRYTVTPQSNRMAYRLEGPTLAHISGADVVSDATPMGAVQVPASGKPILLMADRQTAGGYAKIATVITADLPLAGQLAPGDWIQFRACERAEALKALAHVEHRLRTAFRDA